MRALLVFFILISGPIQAQNIIRGKVLNENKQPADYVDVSLLRTSDSLFVRSTHTDQTGKYEFGHVASGCYRVVISSLGYQKKISDVFVVQGTGLTLSDLRIFPKKNLLKDVVVIGKTPFLEQRADKLVVNVNGALSTGVTAEQILRRVPGIKVLNDKVTMTGKNKVVIMIDGRSTTYQDVNAALRSIPGGNISRIEVISNPSASFDAEGDAIINIILKRNRAAGTNGTIGLAAGGSYEDLYNVDRPRQYYSRYNPSVSINHQEGRMNVFGNYNYMYRSQFEVNLINRYHDGSYYDQRNYNPSQYQTHTYQLGGDFNIDSLNTIGALINGFNRRGRGEFANNSVEKRLVNGDVEDEFNSKNDLENKNNNFAVNLNWRKNYRIPGKRFSADFDLVRYKLESANDIMVSPALGPVINNFQQINNPVNFETVKADFMEPITQKMKLESGAKFSFSKIGNNLFFAENGLMDKHRSSTFNYRENINAVYTNLYYNWHAFDLQAGIRAEQTIANGYSYAADLIDRNYLQLFPSLLISLHLDTAMAITGQYNRRIGRPSYQQQNPFEVYLDPLTYTQGNPLLKPQITNTVKLSLTYTGLPVLAFSYDKTRDIIVDYAPQQKTIIDANGVTRLVSFSVADNLAAGDNFTGQLNFPLKTGSWFDGYGGIITSYQRYQAFYLGTYFEGCKWNFTFFAQGDVKFSSTWSGQISAYYATPSQYEFIKAGKNSSIDGGVSKKLMNNRLKLILSFSDIFWGDRTTGTVNYQDINLKIKQYNDTRNVILALTYSFGGKFAKKSEEHHSGAEEENKRVKLN